MYGNGEFPPGALVKICPVPTKAGSGKVLVCFIFSQPSLYPKKRAPIESPSARGQRSCPSLARQRTTCQFCQFFSAESLSARRRRSCHSLPESWALKWFRLEWYLPVAPLRTRWKLLRKCNPKYFRCCKQSCLTPCLLKYTHANLQTLLMIN